MWVSVKQEREKSERKRGGVFVSLEIVDRKKERKFCVVFERRRGIESYEGTIIEVGEERV